MGILSNVVGLSYDAAEIGQLVEFIAKGDGCGLSVVTESRVVESQAHLLCNGFGASN